MEAAPQHPAPDLLPAPEPGDRRVLLQLRAPDLPGVHDLDPGRHALPRVRPAKDKGEDRTRRVQPHGGEDARNYALIAINVIVFLAELLGGGPAGAGAAAA